jgi:hypothetical protein
MRVLVGIIVLCVAMLSLGDAQTAVSGSQNNAAPASSADLEAIKQLEQSRQDAFVRNDVAALDRETADDYTTINSEGKVSDKPQMMSSLKAAKRKVLSVKLDNLKARIYGNTAVLTGRYDDVSEANGVRKEGHALFTRIFVKNNGQWQAVAYQQTALAAQ